MRHIGDAIHSTAKLQSALPGLQIQSTLRRPLQVTDSPQIPLQVSLNSRFLHFNKAFGLILYTILQFKNAIWTYVKVWHGFTRLSPQTLV
jgi:hypothetical protein